jgi:hypothetical protein
MSGRTNLVCFSVYLSCSEFRALRALFSIGSSRSSCKDQLQLVSILCTFWSVISNSIDLVFYVLWTGQASVHYVGNVFREPVRGQARWSTQHSGNGEAIPCHLGMGWKIQQWQNICVQQTHFGHYYMCTIIIRRLCHMMWSRKWHNLFPQTLLWGFINLAMRAVCIHFQMVAFN